MNSKKGIAGGALFTILLLVCLMWINQALAGNQYKRDITKTIELKGTYSVDKGKSWTEFDNYEQIKGDSYEVILRGHVAEPIPRGDQVMFFLYRLHIRVRVDGKTFLLEKGNNLAHWTKFTSQGITSDNTIELTMTQNKQNAYKGAYRELLQHLQSGSADELLFRQLDENLPKIIFCILTFLVGVASIFAMLGLTYMDVPELRGYFSCGLLLIVGAICTFIDYEYITLIFRNAYMVNIVDMLTQQLIVLLLIVYLSNYLRTKQFRRFARGSLWIWKAGIVVWLALSVVRADVANHMVDFMLVLALVFLAFLCYALCLDFRKYNERRTKYVLFSAGMLLVATVAEIIHFFLVHVFWIYVFQIGLILFALIQYVVIITYSRQKIRDAKKKQELEIELTQSRIRIMLSQIQPHFLYNMLTVIYNLCGKNPKQAQAATARFADYLRGNLDALNKAANVPFEHELEHIESYLELEKLRFEEDLNIVYEIKTVSFMVPPLTIQPLVENAVKHGLGGKEGGGTVTIESEENVEAYIVIVKDDGVGYDKEEVKKDGRSHVGIKNVRDRLREMSGATLEITSKLGVGTVAQVVIPKGEEL